MGKHLIIVGGGAGGASAAAEAKRNDPELNVAILQSGKFIAYASCPTPYYIGDIIKDENRLVARTPEEFRKRGVEVQLDTEVVNINCNANVVETRDNLMLPYDYLVIG
ncbi:MAG TPA: FAD-dependent oxidoreductase, partial [Smithella sp.]|nr:FAD-dependent oxidoreductase [Smithella sp.]